ncbi:hypothetical protein ACFE04_009992 [Oxalis oulophora]
MALSLLCHPQLLLKVDNKRLTLGTCHAVQVDRQRCNFDSRSKSNQVTIVGTGVQNAWSFVQGSKLAIRPKYATFDCCRKISAIHASWMQPSQIASSVFTLGTVAVLPFYTVMVFAPKAELTKKFMESSIPYVVLGFLYAYLLYLSWTPDTLRMMFASQYWLPELPGIAKMFSNEMTLASAWIHLLAVDLFAARQVFYDGMENEVETRHSVSLCLLFCPIGIVTHVITKALTKNEIFIEYHWNLQLCSSLRNHVVFLVVTSLKIFTALCSGGELLNEMLSQSSQKPPETFSVSVR